MSGVPSQGKLVERSLPVLLLELSRAGSDGTLRIEAGGESAEIQLAGGHPVRCDLSGTSSGVVEWLIDQGELSADAGKKAIKAARTKNCTDEHALLGLELIGPLALIGALRAVAGLRLVSLGRHDSGDFRFETAEAAADGAAALRADPVPIAQEIIARHWRPDRMLRDLGAWSEGPIRLTDQGADIAERLAPRDGVAELLAKIDGTASLWSLLGSASRTGPIAALWVLARMGSLEIAPEALEIEAAEPESGTEAAHAASIDPSIAGETEIEIVLSESGASAGATSPEPARPGTEVGADDDAAATLRSDILEMHARLSEIDHYTLLGIERDASPAQIKRAYLLAAKRFHPDALARLGLSEAKAQAGEVFAQIAKAQTVLSDPERQRDYDATLDGHRTVDADQIAQAEILFRKGEMLMRAGNFREAIDYVEASTELWPEDPAYHAAFGWCLYKNHPPDEARAREELERALEIDGEFSVAHLRLGIVLKALGDEDRAAEHTRRGKALDPDARA